MTFSDDFLFGSATAAYQIEGGHNADGKGLSTWDVFCTEPGRIRDNTSGNVACDHYHRFKEDVALMKDLRLQAYRFSISWPRVLPEGDGAPMRRVWHFTMLWLMNYWRQASSPLSPCSTGILLTTWSSASVAGAVRKR